MKITAIKIFYFLCIVFFIYLSYILFFSKIIEGRRNRKPAPKPLRKPPPKFLRKPLRKPARKPVFKPLTKLGVRPIPKPPVKKNKYLNIPCEQIKDSGICYVQQSCKWSGNRTNGICNKK